MSSPSRRSEPLPKDWPRRRRRVLARDAGICHVCGAPECTDVDHIIPAIRGGSDDESNLAPICNACHRTKTAHEARGEPRRRPDEPHPGQVA